MHNVLQYFRSAALLALALFLLPALVFATTTAIDRPEHGSMLIAISLCVGFGIVGVVTYKFQTQGTTVLTSSTIAPTAIQALGFNSLVAEVGLADADTTATITHNWGLSSNAASLFQPWVTVYASTSGTIYPQLAFSVANTNAVVVSKTTGVGSAGTYIVTLQRPNSIVQ